jgi:hypothetical protein
VPDYALDMHTRAGRELGRGARHFYDEGAVVAPAAAIADPYASEARAIDEREEPPWLARARAEQLSLDP